MVLKKSLRLGTALLLAGATLGGVQHATGATSGQHGHAAPSGTVTITDWQFPDGCGPGAASVANQEICGAMQDSMVGLGPDLNYFPDLASEVPSTKNGDVKTVGGNLVVDWKFKPNQKFSDGSPEGASDFVFSVNESLALGNTFGLDQIQNMKILNPTTVEVTYKGIYAPFVAYGSPSPIYPQAYFVKKYGSSDPKAIAAKFGNDVYNSPSDVFNGPFKLQSYTANQSVVLVPNPYYTALPPAAGHPLPAQIVFKNVATNESGLVAQLSSPNSGVDKAEDFQAADLTALANAKGYKVSSVPELTVEHLELNQAGPLKDVRLRQALQYAINKHALYHALFPAVPENQIDNSLLKSVLPNNSPFRDPSIGISEYNPAKAKALLKAAGYATDYNGSGNHLSLRFATTQSTVRQLDFQVLSRDWASIGIHVSPTFASGSISANGGMFSPYNLNGLLATRHFDIALFAFTEAADAQQSEDNFNPDLIPTVTTHSSGDQNYTGVGLGADADEYALLVQARHTLDQGQRKALFNKWQQLVNQRVYWIMLYARSDITVSNGRIGNFIPNGTNSGNEWNAYQYYVKS